MLDEYLKIRGSLIHTFNQFIGILYASAPIFLLAFNSKKKKTFGLFSLLKYKY
jgi:hypothetical protein